MSTQVFAQDVPVAFEGLTLGSRRKGVIVQDLGSGWFEILADETGYPCLTRHRCHLAVIARADVSEDAFNSVTIKIVIE